MDGREKAVPYGISVNGSSKPYICASRESKSEAGTNSYKPGFLHFHEVLDQLIAYYRSEKDQK